MASSYRTFHALMIELTDLNAGEAGEKDRKILMKRVMMVIKAMGISMSCDFFAL